MPSGSPQGHLSAPMVDPQLRCRSALPCGAKPRHDAAAERGEIPTVDFGRLKRVPTAWLRRKLGLELGDAA